MPAIMAGGAIALGFSVLPKSCHSRLRPAERAA
jgi:hypothetical protein